MSFLNENIQTLKDKFSVEIPSFDEGKVFIDHDLRDEGYINTYVSSDDGVTFNVTRTIYTPLVTNPYTEFKCYWEILELLGMLCNSGKIPSLEYESGMGCPSDEIVIGYFDISFDELEETILCFKLQSTNIDYFPYQELLKEHFPSEWSSFIECITEVNQFLMFSGGKTISKFKGFLPESQAFISVRGMSTVGYDCNLLNQIMSAMYINKECVVEVYHGLEFSFVKKKDGEILAYERCGFQKFYDAVSYYGLLDEDDICFSICNNNIVIAECDGIWLVVLPLRENKELSSVEIEKASLFRLFRQLKEISPISDGTNTMIKFDKITASEFEHLCKDILAILGFKNIHSRGNTNAPDGGVDIECDEEVQEIFKTTNKHWIFQCKHMKGQIDRKDISEIPDLINEFNAQGYGLFYSGIFSPQTLDRLKNYQNREFSIQYFDGFNIEQLLLNLEEKVKEDILYKYFLR